MTYFYLKRLNIKLYNDTSHTSNWVIITAKFLVRMSTDILFKRSIFTFKGYAIRKKSLSKAWKFLDNKHFFSNLRCSWYQISGLWTSVFLVLFSFDMVLLLFRLCCWYFFLISLLGSGYNSRTRIWPSLQGKEFKLEKNQFKFWTLFLHTNFHCCLVKITSSLNEIISSTSFTKCFCSLSSSSSARQSRSGLRG